MPTPFARDQLSPQMQARYGLDRRPVGRWIATTVFVLAFLGIMAFVTFGLTRNQLDTRLVTWTSPAPDRVDVAIQVKRPADAEVTCVIRAQDTDRVDVGYATTVIPPGDTDLVVDYRMRTLAPAAAVELLGCASGGAPSVPGPQFPPGVVPPSQPWS